MTEPVLPSERYRQLLDSGRLREDPGQLLAVRELDRVFRELQQTGGRSGPGWWGRLIHRSRARPVRGCYLWGGVGTGKTLLMDLFAGTIPAEQVLRTHFHRFMRDIHTQKNRIRNRQDPLRIVSSRIARTVRVLCLDEFSVLDITDAMIMAGLLGNLLEHGVTLVTTSNTPPGELYRQGLQRARFLPAIDLLESHTIQVHVDHGTDYRMAFLRHNAVFHVPADRSSEDRLAATFSGLVGPGHETAGELEINGRKIRTIAHDAGVAWFCFDALCRTHRSNSDYIEIARQFHTVLVSRIPPLDGTKDDETRRLIELVDELYDRNVNLVASSSRQPHDIYTGRRLKNEFKRTSSRLVEMASDTYLAKPHLSR